MKCGSEMLDQSEMYSGHQWHDDGWQYGAFASLLDRLERQASPDCQVIEWGSPVPVFGDIVNSRVATVGLNPSNREFMDENGAELTGCHRRFPTLNSLGITTWLEADTRHLDAMVGACRTYFHGNPYDAWFRRLDTVTASFNATFYGDNPTACHLDLIPFATKSKWTELSGTVRNELMDLASDSLVQLISHSEIEIIVLNGKSVVDYFQSTFKVDLQQVEIPGASLPRKAGPEVPGFGYRGVSDCLAGEQLPCRLLVLGYNHNLQSSFGVTRRAIDSIGVWLAESVEVFGE